MTKKMTIAAIITLTLASVIPQNCAGRKATRSADELVGLWKATGGSAPMRAVR